MSIATGSLPAPAGLPAALGRRLWRWSVAQYHALIAGGVLTEDDPVELLEGWLVAKTPKNPAHRVATQFIRKALEACIPIGWYVDSQEPITTADSEPEPDVMVIQGRTEDYLARHPGPDKVVLVVEVSDTTLHSDRTLKKQLYARAGIPAYWIVNLGDRQVEAFDQPSTVGSRSTYGRRVDHAADGLIPLVIAGVEVARIPVQSLLPPLL